MGLYRCKNGEYTRNPGDCDNPELVLDTHTLLLISKTMSKILRHEPGDYNVKLTRDGWADLRDLIRAIQNSVGISVKPDVILGISITDPKGRFEVIGTRIRARYGHSIPVQIDYPEAKNVEILYHGTQVDRLNSIMRVGLKPKKRLYVHLSPTPSDACDVASRRKGVPIYLVIDAKSVSMRGIKIVKATDKVYLAKYIPPETITEFHYCE